MLAVMSTGTEAAQAAAHQVRSTSATTARTRPDQKTIPRNHETSLKVGPGRPLRPKVNQRT